MEDCCFDLDLKIDCQCVRCKRTRPFPDEGELKLSDEETVTHIVDTGNACDWNCQETKVKIRVRFGAG